MSIIDEAIVYKVQNDSGLSALIGKKFYPLRMTQGAVPPAATYTKIDVISEHAYSTSATLFGTRYRFSALAKTAKEAKTIAIAFRTCFDGFSGTILSLKIWGVLYLDEFESYDPDAELIEISVDFRVWHTTA